ARPARRRRQDQPGQGGRADAREVFVPAGNAGRGPVPAALPRTSDLELHALAVGLRRGRLPGHAVPGLRPPRALGGLPGVRQARPAFRCRCGRGRRGRPLVTTMELLVRAREALERYLEVRVDPDGALTFSHAGVPCVIQSSELAEGLTVLSLTCVVG